MFLRWCRTAHYWNHSRWWFRRGAWTNSCWQSWTSSPSQTHLIDLHSQNVLLNKVGTFILLLLSKQPKKFIFVRPSSTFGRPSCPHSTMYGNLPVYCQRTPLFNTHSGVLLEYEDRWPRPILVVRIFTAWKALHRPRPAPWRIDSFLIAT